jgi:uncharacterized membrane protein YqhA
MSRYLIGIAVVGTFVGATALLVYGVVEAHALVFTVVGVWLPAAANTSDPPALLAAIGAVDAFLVAVVLYFIAVGLYQLSFHPLPLPEWLLVHDLDELEDKLAQVVVVVLGIAFLGQVVTWDGERDLLGFGVALRRSVLAVGMRHDQTRSGVHWSQDRAPLVGQPLSPKLFQRSRQSPVPSESRRANGEPAGTLRVRMNIAAYVGKSREGLCRNCVRSPRKRGEMRMLTGSHRAAFCGGKSLNQLRE